MLAKYKHILWDWNGTLLNDIELSVNIINGMLRERNLPAIDIETYQHLIEFPVENYYRKLGFDFSAESFEQLATQYIGIYNSRMGNCKLHNGVADFLHCLKNQGKSQSILSSLEHSSLIRETKHHNVFDCFELVRGLDDHYAAGKTEVGRKLIQELKVEPSRTVLIGDTAHDFEVATELGIDCILLSIGHYSIQRLHAIHDRVFTSIQYLVSDEKLLVSA